MHHPLDIGLVRVAGQRDDFDARVLGFDLSGGADTVDTRHPDIHENHIRPVEPDLVDGLLAVSGFGHHVHAPVRVKNLPDALPENRVIIHDQNSYT